MAYSGPTIVQAVSVDYSGLGPSNTPAQSPAFGSPNTLGNSILVAVRYTGIDNATGLTITDLAGNTYTLVFSAGNAAGGKCNASIWRADNIAAHTGNKITVTAPVAAGFGGFDAVETTPLGPVDKTGSATNAAGGVFGPTVTPAANELCVGAGADDGGFTWAVGTSVAWVQLGTGTNEGITESFGQATSTPTQADMHSNGAPKQVAIIATFPNPPPPTHSISGNAGKAGATVALTGTATASTTADGSGNYSFSGLSDGPYTITPTLRGYKFTPKSHAETLAGSNITGVNFTAKKNISGRSK